MCNCYECRIRGRSEIIRGIVTDAEEFDPPVLRVPIVPNDITLGKQMVFPGLTTEEMSAKL